MIAVIADDFSGAAEIAGIGFRCRLKCEVVTECIPDHRPDLLVIDTNTRSSSESEAKERIKKTALNLPEVNWIYKKTDSVFRGHVAAELETLLETLDIPSALLIPANPSMGRRIIHGIYSVDDRLLHETTFSEDPEGSYASSDVIELLNASCKSDVFDYSTFEKEKIPRIVIGNADQSDHLKQWTSKLQNGILPAGGADFFSAILDSKGFQCNQSPREDCFPITERLLILHGARNQLEHDHEKTLGSQESGVNHIEFIFNGIEELNDQKSKEWILQITKSLRENRVTFVRFYTNAPRTLTLSQTLTAFTGDLIQGIFYQKIIPHIIIEGGSTASSIIRRMDWNRWIPVQELNPGTVTLKEKESGITMTVKPGSYTWPESIKRLIYSTKY